MKTIYKINHRGFSLLEILITMAIVTSSLILSSSFIIKRKDNRKKSTFRQFVALNRQLDHSARLKRETWRLVIHLDENKNSWWVEKKLPYKKVSNYTASTENQTLSFTGFVIDTNFFAKPQKLPGELKFESVEVSGKKDKITSGKAYIHYFPEGQFDNALLKIKKRNIYWSLFIDRLSGDLTVFTGNKNLKDFKQ